MSAKHSTDLEVIMYLSCTHAHCLLPLSQKRIVLFVIGFHNIDTCTVAYTFTELAEILSAIPMYGHINKLPNSIFV